MEYFGKSNLFFFKNKFTTFAVQMCLLHISVLDVVNFVKK